jgi:haloalkane dehalogenase
MAIIVGDSDKLDTEDEVRYSFVEHRRYLDRLLDQIDLGDQVILVLHDWGSALGFDWAMRHAERVAGICYVEAIVKPMGWEERAPKSAETFKMLRSPVGAKKILVENFFVERILPSGIIRTLTPEEFAHYHAPFAIPGPGRLPTLAWPRQIPIDGAPADVAQIVTAYGKWLASSPTPKLFVHAEPGALGVA